MAHKVRVDRFGMVPRNDVPRSAFDVEHLHKTTFNASYLIPLYVEEVLPGDTISCRMTLFARLSTPIVPVMDNLYLESFFFFVPNRLVWSNWERFMGEQNSITDTTSFLVPYLQVTELNCVPGTLEDYFGITVNNNAAADTRANALPFRAYYLIWNDWFRDQDLQSPLTVATGDGPDTYGSYSLLTRNKKHDYFTSARPWPQKVVNQHLFTSQEPLQPGQSMTMPWAGAPLTGIGVGTGTAPTVGALDIDVPGARDTSVNPYFTTATTAFVMRADSVTGYPDVRILVNDLRTATLVQMFMEKNARGGTRYAELVRSHFGVDPQDARLQRPEYLGGGRSMVSVNPVAQTSASGVAGTTTVLGEQAGVGSVVAQHGFSQSFSEHGFILGLVNVRPELTYQQGIHKMWKRRTLWDYYWPTLNGLGEQAITRNEIYSVGDATDLTVFGYQERWAEYKYKPSRTSGYFRSTDPTPLDMWHFGQEFGSAPVLNGGFVSQTYTEVDRVLQSSTNFGQQFLCDALFKVRMARCMPMHSIPGMGARL